MIRNPWVDPDPRPALRFYRDEALARIAKASDGDYIRVSDMVVASVPVDGLTLQEHGDMKMSLLYKYREALYSSHGAREEYKKSVLVGALQ